MIMRIELSYKCSLYEVCDPCSFSGAISKLVGMPFKFMQFYDYDNPYRREISKIDPNELKVNKHKYKYLEDAHKDWVKDNAYKLTKSNFVYKCDHSIDVEGAWFPFPEYFRCTEDFEIPNCSPDEFDISKLIIYYCDVYINDLFTGEKWIYSIEYDNQIVYEDLKPCYDYYNCTGIKCW